MREILVRDGAARARRRQPLVVVGDVRSDAELSLLHDQLRADAGAQGACVGRGRAGAGHERAAGADRARRAAEHLARERALFAARRRTLDEQIASLHEQVRQAHAQAAALKTRSRRPTSRRSYADEETQINDSWCSRASSAARACLRCSAARPTRVPAWPSSAASWPRRASASASCRRAARKLRKQLSEPGHRRAEGSIGAAARDRKRLRPSTDQVERQLVRAPVDGEVMAVRVSAIGEAIAPREPMLDVVPADEKLVVEARMRPEDMDHVRERRHSRSAPARLRRARHAAAAGARGVRLARPRDRDGRAATSWFVATVEVDADVLKATGRSCGCKRACRPSCSSPRPSAPLRVPREAARRLREPCDARAVERSRAVPLRAAHAKLSTCETFHRWPDRASK